jgi:hypothetical protein
MRRTRTRMPIRPMPPTIIQPIPSIMSCTPFLPYPPQSGAKPTERPFDPANAVQKRSDRSLDTLAHKSKTGDRLSFREIIRVPMGLGGTRCRNPTAEAVRAS